MLAGTEYENRHAQEISKIEQALDELLTEVLRIWRLVPIEQTRLGQHSDIIARDFLAWARYETPRTYDPQENEIEYLLYDDPIVWSHLISIRKLGVRLFEIGGDSLMCRTSESLVEGRPNWQRRTTIFSIRWNGIGSGKHHYWSPGVIMDDRE